MSVQHTSTHVPHPATMPNLSNRRLGALLYELLLRIARYVLAIFCCCCWSNDVHASTPTRTTTMQVESDLDALILSQLQTKERTTVAEIQNLSTASRETIKAAFVGLVNSCKLKQNGRGKATFYTLGTGQVSEKPSLDEAFKLLKPENDLENKIVNDPEWIEGAGQGVPRPGHPEGQIVYHVLEVLQNVETWCQEHHTSSENRAKLRVIAMIHDTFKHKVDRTQPKVGDNHHAFIARKFAEKIDIKDREILVIIEHHDDAYNAWNTGNHGDWSKGDQKAKRLLNTLRTSGVSLDLFNAFYWCDSKTGDKELTPYQWFQKYVNPSQEPQTQNELQNLILSTLRELGTISINSLQQKYPQYNSKAGYHTLRDTLDAMVRARVIKQIGRGKETTYQLNP